MKRRIWYLLLGIVIGFVLSFLDEQYILLHNIANFLSQLTQRGS